MDPNHRVIMELQCTNADCLPKEKQMELKAHTESNKLDIIAGVEVYPTFEYTVEAIYV